MSYDGSSRVDIETPESDLSKNIYDEEMRAEFESEEHFYYDSYITQLIINESLYKSW